MPYLMFKDTVWTAEYVDGHRVTEWQYQIQNNIDMATIGGLSKVFETLCYMKY